MRQGNGADWRQNLNCESKWQTSCWTEDTGPTGIFVHLVTKLASRDQQ